MAAMAHNMTKDIVRMNIDSGKYVLKVKKHVKNRALWSRFRTVNDARTDQYLDHVQCVACRKLFFFERRWSNNSSQQACWQMQRD